MNVSKIKRQTAETLWFRLTPNVTIAPDKDEISLLRGWIGAAIQGLEIYRKYKNETRKP